jgi:penicillin G amidase
MHFDKLKNLLKTGLPLIEGNFTTSGLKAPVNIIRDEWGCPHIEAENDHDVWFGSGFCHAQDRFWQIERARRFASGRMAEIIGEPLLRLDEYYRRVGLRRSAEVDWHLLNDPARQILQTFSDGVNAGIKSFKQLPSEFNVLDIVPEPWNPVDSIAIWKLTLLSQAEDYNAKIFRAAILHQRGPDVLKVIEPEYPEEAPIICPPGLKGDFDRELDETLALAVKLSPLSSPEIGSNNWAIDSTLSASGKPMIAGDPHAVIHISPIWYFNHLITPDWQMMGVSSPGVPGILFYGHNGHVAWAGTNPMADIADLFIERFDNGYHKYLYKSHWHKAEIWHEEIKVKGQEKPVLEDVPVTNHGPIITGGPFGNGKPLALKWTGQSVMRTFECIDGMARAKNVDDFKESQRNWGGSHMNRVAADDSGNITYQLIGDIPIRAHGGASPVPVPGWTGEYDWVGNISFEDLPFYKNPGRHFIATANNRIASADYKYHVNIAVRPYRGWRIEELLDRKKRFQVKDFINIQADKFCRPAYQISKLLVKIKEATSLIEAKTLLDDWDCLLSHESSAAAVYEVFIQKLLGKIFSFAKELPGSASLDNWEVCYLPKLIKQIKRKDTSPLKINQATCNKTWDEVIADCCTEACQFLKEKFGDDSNGWTWGKLHRQTFIHNLGRKPPYDSLFNLPSVEIGGDSTTVCSSWASYQGDFTTNCGTSFRMIIDLGDLNKSLWMLPPGNSGHAGSAHYGDGIKPWLNIDYFPMLWDKAEIIKHQENNLCLVPSNIK